MDDMREHPYINVSSAAINTNKTASLFEINAPQYTSLYKTNWNLSFLPVQAHFDSNKYRTKKPIPSNNTYVSIEGFLENVETDPTGRAIMFHVSVDNINFLRWATLSPSGTGNTGNISISFFVSFPFLSVQLPRCHPVLLTSNSTLTLRPVHPQIQLSQIPLPLPRIPRSVY